MPLPHYVIRPVISLLEHWEIKLPIAFLLGWGWWVGQRLVGLYDQLLSTDPLLLLMAVSIFLIDWVSGIAAAIRDGEGIQSRRFRQAGWKFIEYTCVVAVCIMLSNAADGKLVEPIFQGFDDAALFYVGLTEARSVAENVERAQWLQSIRSLTQGTLPQDKSKSE